MQTNPVDDVTQPKKGFLYGFMRWDSHEPTQTLEKL